MMWAGRMSRVAHIVGMSVGRSQVDGRAGERYRDQLRVIGVDKRRIQRIFLAVRRTSSVSGEHWTGRRSRRLYIGSHASGIGAGEAGGRARRSWPQTVGPWPSARAAESRGGHQRRGTTMPTTRASSRPSCCASAGAVTSSSLMARQSVFRRSWRTLMRRRGPIPARVCSMVRSATLQLTFAFGCGL